VPEVNTAEDGWPGWDGGPWSRPGPVTGPWVAKYLDRLGYESTGQILPVADEAYRLRA